MTTPRPLIVYRWTTLYRPDLPKDGTTREARCVVAAPSKRVAYEILAKTVGDWDHVRHDRLDKSEDPGEVEAALASPGEALWRPTKASGRRFVRWGDPWESALERPRTNWEVYALRKAVAFEQNGADEEAQELRDDVAAGILTEGAFRETVGNALFVDVNDKTFRRRVSVAVAEARRLREGGPVPVEAPLWLGPAEREATALLFDLAAKQARHGALGLADRWARLGLGRVSADEETFREALAYGGVARGEIQQIIDQVYARVASKGVADLIDS